MSDFYVVRFKSGCLVAYDGKPENLPEYCELVFSTDKSVYCPECGSADELVAEDSRLRLAKLIETEARLALALEALRAAPEHICQGVWHTDACEAYRKLRAEALGGAK